MLQSEGDHDMHPMPNNMAVTSDTAVYSSPTSTCAIATASRHQLAPQPPQPTAYISPGECRSCRKFDCGCTESEAGNYVELSRHCEASSTTIGLHKIKGGVMDQGGMNGDRGLDRIYKKYKDVTKAQSILPSSPYPIAIGLARSHPFVSSTEYVECDSSMAETVNRDYALSPFCLTSSSSFTSPAVSASSNSTVDLAPTRTRLPPAPLLPISRSRLADGGICSCGCRTPPLTHYTANAYSHENDQHSSSYSTSISDTTSPSFFPRYCASAFQPAQPWSKVPRRISESDGSDTFDWPWCDDIPNQSSSSSISLDSDATKPLAGAAFPVRLAPITSFLPSNSRYAGGSNHVGDAVKMTTQHARGIITPSSCASSKSTAISTSDTRGAPTTSLNPILSPYASGGGDYMISRSDDRPTTSSASLGQDGTIPSSSTNTVSASSGLKGAIATAKQSRQRRQSLVDKYPILLPTISRCLQVQHHQDAGKSMHCPTAGEIRDVVIECIPGIKERGGISIYTVRNLMRMAKGLPVKKKKKRYRSSSGRPHTSSTAPSTTASIYTSTSTAPPVYMSAPSTTAPSIYMSVASMKALSGWANYKPATSTTALSAYKPAASTTAPSVDTSASSHVGSTGVLRNLTSPNPHARRSLFGADVIDVDEYGACKTSTPATITMSSAYQPSYTGELLQAESQVADRDDVRADTTTTSAHITPLI